MADDDKMDFQMSVSDPPTEKERKELLTQLRTILPSLMPILEGYILSNPDPTDNYAVVPPHITPLTCILPQLHEIMGGSGSVSIEQLTKLVDNLSIGQTTEGRTSLLTVGPAASLREEGVPYRQRLEQATKREDKLLRSIQEAKTSGGYFSTTMFNWVRTPGTDHYYKRYKWISTGHAPDPKNAKKDHLGTNEAEEDTTAREDAIEQQNAGGAAVAAKKAKTGEDDGLVQQAAGGGGSLGGAAAVAMVEALQGDISKLLNQLESTEAANKMLVDGATDLVNPLAWRYNDVRREEDRKIADSVLGEVNIEFLVKALCDCTAQDPGHAVQDALRAEVAAVLGDQSRREKHLTKIAEREQTRAEVSQAAEAADADADAAEAANANAANANAADAKASEAAKASKATANAAETSKTNAAGTSNHAQPSCWNCFIINNHRHQPPGHQPNHVYQPPGHGPVTCDHSAPAPGISNSNSKPEQECNECAKTGAVCRQLCTTCHELGKKNLGTVPPTCQSCRIFTPAIPPMRLGAWYSSGLANTIPAEEQYVANVQRANDGTNHRRFASSKFSVTVNPDFEMENDGLDPIYLGRLQLAHQFKKYLTQSSSAFYRHFSLPKIREKLGPALRDVQSTQSSDHPDTVKAYNIAINEVQTIMNEVRAVHDDLTRLYLSTGRISACRAIVNINHLLQAAGWRPQGGATFLPPQVCSRWDQHTLHSTNYYVYVHPDTQRAMWDVPTPETPPNTVVIPGQPDSASLLRGWQSLWNVDWQMWVIYNPDGLEHAPPPQEIGLAPGSPVSLDPESHIAKALGSHEPPRLAVGSTAVYDPINRQWQIGDPPGRPLSKLPGPPPPPPPPKTDLIFNFEPLLGAKFNWESPTSWKIFNDKIGQSLFREFTSLKGPKLLQQVRKIHAVWKQLQADKKPAIAAQWRSKMAQQSVPELDEDGEIVVQTPVKKKSPFGIPTHWKRR